jgi:hypothetical protein
VARKGVQRTPRARTPSWATSGTSPFLFSFFSASFCKAFQNLIFFKKYEYFAKIRNFENLNFFESEQFLNSEHFLNLTIFRFENSNQFLFKQILYLDNFKN